MAVGRIPEFIESLKTASDKASIYSREMEYLRDSLNSIHSLKRELSRYRNQLREHFQGNPDELQTALDAMNLSEDEERFISTASRQSIAADQLELTEIDADALVIKGEKLLQAQSYIKIVLGLAILTGRRPIEILRSGRFHRANEVSEAIAAAKANPDIANRKNSRIANASDIAENVRTLGTDQYILFSGQAKQNDSPDSALQPYPIPVLTNPEKVLEAIERLRTLKPEFLTLEPTAAESARGKTAQDIIHSKTNKNLSGKISGTKHPDNFGELLPAKKCNPKGLRAAYAEINYAWNHPQGKVAKAIYFSRILGHVENDVKTSQSYVDFTIS